MALHLYARKRLCAAVLHLAQSSNVPLARIQSLEVLRLKNLDLGAYPSGVQARHDELVRRISAKIEDPRTAEEAAELIVALYGDVCETEGYAREHFGLARRIEQA